jgi:hypothetical protein
VDSRLIIIVTSCGRDSPGRVTIVCPRAPRPGGTFPITLLIRNGLPKPSSRGEGSFRQVSGIAGSQVFTILYIYIYKATYYIGGFNVNEVGIFIITDSNMPKICLGPGQVGRDVVLSCCRGLTCVLLRGADLLVRRDLMRPATVSAEIGNGWTGWKGRIRRGC